MQRKRVSDKMISGTDLIVEHYNKTYDLTFNLWEARNKILLSLFLCIGVTVFLTFNVAEAQPLLIDIITKSIGITDAARISELRKSFPYSVVHSALLLVIMYLIINLYHRSAFIHRNYAYLSKLEEEIRFRLSIKKTSKVFSRESTFYNENKTFASKYIGVIYVLVVSFFVLSFLSVRLYLDISSASRLIIFYDLAVGLVISVYLYSWAKISI
ncbi:hypothetical protein [Pantoea sp. EEL5]|uniref:hypothetical protein n=1 Tax=Pantoea sp. EEL5 TaxID=3416806 RepID=UPI003CF898D8